MADNRYPPISDYAFIGDCHAVALVSRGGSMDWCCMPRIDSRSCFGRLLDWERGGYFSITPSGSWQSSRRYLDGTLVLETGFTTAEGTARLLDCLPMRVGGAHTPYRQILRVLGRTAGLW